MIKTEKSSENLWSTNKKERFWICRYSTNFYW